MPCYFMELDGGIKLNPHDKVDGFLWIDKNYKKKGIKGYIGGNVLMEMAVAFFLEKPIYILNAASKKSALYEEVMAIQPRFLKGNLNNIK